MKRLEEWIEWMEGEAEFKKTGDLNLLLKHSLADQTVLDNLRRLRRAVEQAHESKSVEKLLNNQTYLEKLHAQIMRGVRRRPESPELRVVPSDNVSALETDQPISLEIYNRREMP